MEGLTQEEIDRMNATIAAFYGDSMDADGDFTPAFLARVNESSKAREQAAAELAAVEPQTPAEQEAAAVSGQDAWCVVGHDIDTPQGAVGAVWYRYADRAQAEAKVAELEALADRADRPNRIHFFLMDNRPVTIGTNGYVVWCATCERQQRQGDTWPQTPAGPQCPACAAAGYTTKSEGFAGRDELTTAEAGAQLGIAPETVTQYVRRGLLTARTQQERGLPRLYIRQSEVDRYRRERRSEGYPAGKPRK